MLIAEVGAVAQLGERLVCNQEATGSIPVSSTRNQALGASCKSWERSIMRIVESIVSLGPFLIPIAAFIVGGVITIVVLILRHQERIAKIERGIDPDFPRRQ